MLMLFTKFLISIKPCLKRQASGLLCLFILLPLACPSWGREARQVSCYVVKISDGDSFSCLLANKKAIRVRLAEIDAPEKRQPFGNKARQTLANLIYKQQVRLVISGYDRYQRTLATVYHKRGQNINLLMVKQGLAWAYEPYVQDPRYTQAQQQARRKRLGLWQDRHPIAPHLWRKQAKKQAGK